MFQNDNVTTDLTYGLVNDQGFEDMAISRVIQMCFGLLNAFVKFKIGGSNQSFSPKTGILAYFVLIIMLIVLYTFILTLKNMFIFFQIDLSYEKVIHV